VTVTSFLPRLVDLASRRPWATIVAALLLTVGASLFAASHGQMTSDATALISPNVPWRAAERRMDAAFPANGDIVLVVVDGATPERAEQATRALTERLSADKKHFRAVYRPDGGPWFEREGLLFLEPKEVQATTAQMIRAQPFLGPLAADPSLRGVATTLSTMLMGIEQGQASLDQIDPAMKALADALERQQAGKSGAFSWNALFGTKGGSLTAPTRRLILVRPVLDYQALMPGADADDAIRAAAHALSLDPAHDVTVRLTGSVPLQDEEFASLQENWGLVAGVMALAMLGTLWLATRSARITAAILVTTVAGLAITTALGLAMVGRLTLISVAFIPLFVGLGVDFGIQLAVRFQSERHDGLETREALQAAAAALGAPLMLAAGAVCLGFLAFLPTSYSGVAELGLIASVGMIVALVASMTLLPALVTVAGSPRPAAEVGTPTMARTDAFLLGRRKLVLVLFGIAMAASIASLPFVRFDFDPLNLRDQTSEAMATLADLRKDPDRNPNTIDILAPNIGAAQALAGRLGKLPQVDRVLTAASFVPEEQAPKLATIADAKTILDLTLNPFASMPPASDAETVAALRATVAGLRKAEASLYIPAEVGFQSFDAPPADPRLHRLDERGKEARRLASALQRLADGPPAARKATSDMLVPPLGIMLDQLRNSLEAAPVTLADLPGDITRDWIAPDGRARVQVVPKAAYASGAGLKTFTRAVTAIAPDATGTAVSIQGAASTIAQAFIIAGILALAIVSALLFVALRDAKEVAFTLAPVVLSGFLTLGTCVVIGQPINFANIIAFPLLFGVGVAFHIYFVMAWRSGATNLLQSALARAIFFSAMATGTAFGSLWLSKHPGTASMGKVLMLSLVWTLICALIFEPALLGPPRKTEKPI